jgi:tRNA U55 pseudouridine synthase TruB
MYSAIKQDGKPLYEYARAGVTREREPRRILIHEMNLLSWRAPDVEFDVRCSKGAYIRVLAEDLARILGTLAHLTALRRLCVAPFVEGKLWGLEALEGLSLNARRLQRRRATTCQPPRSRRCDRARRSRCRPARSERCDSIRRNWGFWASASSKCRDIWCRCD